MFIQAFKKVTYNDIIFIHIKVFICVNYMIQKSQFCFYDRF